MPLLSPLATEYMPGQVTRSGGHKSVTAIHSKGGSTRGQSVITFTGTPAYGSLVQYQVDLTRTSNGQVSNSTGLFTYHRGPGAASLADFLIKFASHLTRYHDVESIAVTGTTITIRSDYYGFTPNLIISTPGITAANVATGAVAAGHLYPGDLVVINQSTSGFIALPFRTANITAASLFGVTLRDMKECAKDGRDGIYDILVEGYVAALCGGTTAKTPATTTLNAFTDGNRPGMMSFGGLSHGATVSLSLSAVNTSGAPLTPVNISRQIRAITADVLPGQTFEIQLSGI
jgi:hypothetical protein